MSSPTMHRMPALLGLVVILALGLTTSGIPITTQEAPIGVQTPSGRIGHDFRSSPVMFIENTGQWDDAARFQVWGGTAGTMWLAEDAIWITVLEAGETSRQVDKGFDARWPFEGREEPAPQRGVNIKLSFMGANLHPLMETFDRLDTVVSYFIGNEPDRWRAAVAVWGGVRYVDLYPGVDLEITSEGGRMVQRLAAHAGADVSAVRLRVEGADAVTVDGDVLRLITKVGDVVLPLLLVEGTRGDSAVQSHGTQLFEVIAPLATPNVGSQCAMSESTGHAIFAPQSVTDNPADLLYSTFLGGSISGVGRCIAVDELGYVYVTGSFYPSETAVVKLNPIGTALAYATFLGGSSSENGTGITVDGSGAAYITGVTLSADFPTTPGAFDQSHNGDDDAFVVKLNPAGSALAYATFLGGNDFDWVEGIAVDESGAAYITGVTLSADFPTTPGAFDQSHNVGDDPFVVKLNPAGSVLAYATFLGGSGADWGSGIAVDAGGVAYVTGETHSIDFPVTPGAFDPTFNSNFYIDAFVVKLNPTGSALAYSTFLGGNHNDKGESIAVDGNGVAYVTGYTNSANFPTTPGAFDQSYNGDGGGYYGDAFVVKLDFSGSTLAYGTFLGGSDDDGGFGIAVDAGGVAYVTGETHSIDFPVTPGAFDRSRCGAYCADAFVVKLAIGGSVDPPTPTPIPTYTISGRVTEAGGFTGIGGVTVWADSTHSTTTNANGDYTLTGLPAGTYSVRPSLTPYAFSPVSRLVSVPTNQTGVNFRKVAITKVQVNQALGNTTNYVAGKDTVIQVMLSDYVRYDQANQQVVVKLDDAYVTTLKPLKSAFPTQTLDFWGKMEDCGNWRQGSYTFEVTVNGSQMVQDAVRFSERQPLRILAVPVKIKVNGQILIPSDRWKSAEEFVRQTYPVANKGILYQPADRMLDGTFWDLTTEGGRTALFLELSLYQPVSCTLGLGPCYDAIFGIIPQAQLCPSPPCTEGWTSWPPAAVVMDNKNLPTIMAHELGHGLGYNHLFVVPGLGDEYGGQCGVFQCDDNPPPQNYLGKTSTYGSCSHHCSDATVQPWDSWMGSAVLPEDGPFEVGGRLGLGRKLSFMGAAGENQSEYWVTPHAYDSLFGQLAPRAGAAATLATERVADVRGWIQQDDHAFLDPAYYLDAVAPPVAAGPYSVEVLDAGGAILSSQGFDVSFVLLSNPPQNIEQAYFRVAVRFPQGARTVRVKHGATVLAERIISAHAPTLSLTSPTAGQTWAATGNYTIRWQGNDLDGDALHYTVLYRQGTGDWIVLGADLTANELTVDAAGLPGGTAAQVQVLATDGINTTTAESGLFTVDRKGPQAFITYPAEGASFMPGVSFFLQGTAYDLEDGALPDPAYRWRSNRDGDLGTGATNLVILSPGPHVITLTVTDSDGNTAVKTIRLSAGSQQFMPLILRSQ